MTTQLPPAGIFLLRDCPRGVTMKSGSEPRISQLSNEELMARVASDCFVCHKPLTGADEESKDSNEDIFPQWLQRHFDLRDRKINLLDGSSIKYREALVPCCNKCNNEAMSKVENRISRAVKAGFSKVTQLSRSDLFLWTAKILYGLLHLEVKPRHRKTKEMLEPLVLPEVFDHLSLTMMLLNGFRKRVIIDAPAWPFSILLFPLKAGGPPHLNFHYRDSFGWPTALAIRLGETGMIVSFEDFGHTERWYEGELKPLLGGKVLHPLQFSEMVAHVFYHGGLVGYNFKYTAMESVDYLGLTLRPEPVLGYKPDYMRLAETISEYTGGPLEKLWDDELKILKSIMVQPNGSFLDLPFAEGVEYSM